MKFSIVSKKLEFLKPAITSRGEYVEKTTHLISLSDSNYCGLGEASPLADLSTDGKADFHAETLDLLNLDLSLNNILELLEQWQPAGPKPLPALRFALHCAWKELNYKRLSTTPLSHKTDSFGWLKNDFTQGIKGMKINGLVWMNGADSMYAETLDKIAKGFKCIKIKVGALDFNEECRLIEKIRSKYSPFQVELRLDANGGFDSDTALEKINELHRFNIHSIEQPTKQGCEIIDKICACSKIDIALDESLIGLHPDIMGTNTNSGQSLLRWAKPKYIILKPSLLGGTDLADQWIKIATALNIKWWSTSALEGNVALSAIAQWVSQYSNPLPQGLGTGALFKDNFAPQTQVIGEEIWYLKP